MAVFAKTAALSAMPASYNVFVRLSILLRACLGDKRDVFTLIYIIYTQIIIVLIIEIYNKNTLGKSDFWTK